MLGVDPDVLWDRRVSGSHYLEAKRILNSAPSALQTALVARYAELAGSTREYWASCDGRVLDSWNEAAADLRRTGKSLQACRSRIAYDDDALEHAADQSARICLEVETFANASAYARSQHVNVPAVAGRITERSVAKRLRSPDWWRRQLRTHLTRGCEELFRVFGFVRSPIAPYVSDDGFERIRAAGFKGRLWMENTSAVCEGTGEILPLLQIAEHSLANPSIRRGELMIRARGFQEIAELERHRCMMITLTCPSAFHAWLRQPGIRNPSFKGFTPRDGQQWLTKRWASCRAILKRERVHYYGFRVAEPHHDATPHWHMVVYADADALDRMREILSRSWLHQYQDEPGALQHRIKFTEEDPSKGSGVGYLAKYVSKNIDAAGSIGGQPSDESNRPVSQEALRAVAWSRLHGIRQFQQLGGPAVTLWRHLRRVREPCEWPPLESLRLTTTHEPIAAQTEGKGSGDHTARMFHPIPATSPNDTDGPQSDFRGPSWSRFIQALGGIAHCLAASRSFWEKQEPRTIDPQGRRVLKLTRWGELPCPMIVGLRVVWAGPDGVERVRFLPTRIHVWFLIFCPRSGRLSTLGPVAITVAGAPTVGAPSAWTNPYESSQAPPMHRGISK